MDALRGGRAACRDRRVSAADLTEPPAGPEGEFAPSKVRLQRMLAGL